MIWVRRSSSAQNFDLILANPETLDGQRINEMLDRIQEEKHRGLSLNSRADVEFRRWAKDPSTPLKSDAYVLLSNWFLTQSGDRRSMVASRCADLWDELFPSRPLKRLSSPEPGRNHVMLAAEFENFWQRILEAQADRTDVPNHASGEAQIRTIQPVTHREPRYRSVPSAKAQAEALDASDVADGSASGTTVERYLTIAEAKVGLARSFGVRPENVEITIRG